MHCKTVTILLRIRDRGHCVMSITKNHESHYVSVLDNPLNDANDGCLATGERTAEKIYINAL